LREILDRHRQFAVSEILGGSTLQRNVLPGKDRSRQTRRASRDERNDASCPTEMRVECLLFRHQAANDYRQPVVQRISFLGCQFRK